MNKKNVPPYLHRVHLSFIHRDELYTVVEFDLGLFDRMSSAEHIRRMIQASNPQFIVQLSSCEVKNPRLTYDLSVPNDYRIF